MSWSFKVERIIHQIPTNSQLVPIRTADFQSQNRSTVGALNPVSGSPVPPVGSSPPAPGTNGNVIDLG
jgi:hypothetical protein